MDLRLPNLGEGADSGVVVNVFVKEGDPVAKDQAVIELENEKAVASIPSTAAGVVSKIHVKPGDKLSVGQRILSLSAGGTSAAPAPTSTAKRAEPTTAAQAPVEETAVEETTAGTGEETSKPVAAPVASPSVRKIARELG